jgi:hypothetical protein
VSAQTPKSSTPIPVPVAPLTSAPTPSLTVGPSTLSTSSVFCRTQCDRGWMNPEPTQFYVPEIRQFSNEVLELAPAPVAAPSVSVAPAAVADPMIDAGPKNPPCCSQRVPTKLDGWGIQPEPTFTPQVIVPAPVAPKVQSPRPKQTFTAPRLSGMGQAQFEAEQKREREGEGTRGGRGRDSTPVVEPELQLQQQEQPAQKVPAVIPQPKPASNRWPWGQRQGSSSSKSQGKSTAPPQYGDVQQSNGKTSGKATQNKGSTWRWGSNSKSLAPAPAVRREDDDVDSTEEDDD